MNRIEVFLVVLITLSVGSTFCQNSIDRLYCNQQIFGSKNYIHNLPAYVCIPDGYIIDDYIRWADINHDGHYDFLAIKYNKRQDDQVDGDNTFWNFYTRNSSNDTFRLTQTLQNIVPPFVSDIGLEYVSGHQVADSLYRFFPRRLSHQLSFRLRMDSLCLSYKFDDSFGKTFVFAYNPIDANWYLQNVEFFLGELPQYWCRDDDFYYQLNDQLKVIEQRTPQKRVSIDKFDLQEAFRHRDLELTHLMEHIDAIRKDTNKSILNVKFEKCNKSFLPASWLY